MWTFQIPNANPGFILGIILWLMHGKFFQKYLFTAWKYLKKVSMY